MQELLHTHTHTHLLECCGEVIRQFGRMLRAQQDTHCLTSPLILTHGCQVFRSLSLFSLSFFSLSRFRSLSFQFCFKLFSLLPTPSLSSLSILPTPSLSSLSLLPTPSLSSLSLSRFPFFSDPLWCVTLQKRTFAQDFRKRSKIRYFEEIYSKKFKNIQNMKGIKK